MFFIYFSMLLVVKGDLRIFLYSLPYSHLTIYPSRYLKNTHLTQHYVFRKSFVRSLFFQKNSFLTIHSSSQIAFYTDSTSFYAILQHPAVKLRKGLLAFMQSCVVWFCCCWQCAFFLSSSSHHSLSYLLECTKFLLFVHIHTLGSVIFLICGLLIFICIA